MIRLLWQVVQARAEANLLWVAWFNSTRTNDRRVNFSPFSSSYLKVIILTKVISLNFEWWKYESWDKINIGEVKSSIGRRSFLEKKYLYQFEKIRRLVCEITENRISCEKYSE